MLEQYKEIELFGETDFQEKMDTVVKPFLGRELRTGNFQSMDGTRIHYSYVLHPQEKAAIVISHGFCEFIGKYHEIMYYFFQAGYSVFFIDHRGHGYSQRYVDEMDKVYIKSFNEYVTDLKEFMELVVKKRSLSGQYLLFAHSMGGAIGTLFLEQYPSYFKAAILSSPMIQMNIGKIPDWKVKLLFFWSAIAHRNKQFVPGQHGFDHVYSFEESSALSEPRYAYMFRMRQQIPEYQSYGGTYAWTKAAVKASKEIKKNAEKVKIPVLLFQAGRDTMVIPEAQDFFVEKSANTTFIRFPESKHEIFNADEEMRKKYFNDIFAFLERNQ